MLAWTRRLRPGHRRPRHADRVQHRRPGASINGDAPTFADFPAGLPGAVLGGAPKAKLAPFGDIYFSFDFSTQFGYLLSHRARRST